MTVSEEAKLNRRFAIVRGSRRFKNVRSALGLEEKRVLDAGCGYGEHLVFFGSGSVGLTTTRAEVEYGKQHNLTIIEGNLERLAEVKLPGRFDAVWANNIFEHLLSPHAFLIELKTAVAQDGVVVLGVPMITVFPSLFLRLRRYRGVLASNHTGFFTRHTLRLTAQYAGWQVEELRPFFFKNRLLDRLATPFAPNLYLVARNDPAFVYSGKKLKEWEYDPHYRRLLAIAGPRK